MRTHPTQFPARRPAFRNGSPRRARLPAGQKNGTSGKWPTRATAFKSNWVEQVGARGLLCHKIR